MIEAIIDSFRNLTPILWASQIIGLIGLFILFASYQLKKEWYFVFACISMVFFFFEQLLAGLYSNLIVTTIAMFRFIIQASYTLKGKEKAPDYWIVIIIAMVWISLFVLLAISNGWAVWENYLPPALTTLAAITSNNKNYYVLKVGMLINETGFLIYYIIYNLPFSILRQIILVSSIIVSIIVMLIKSYKEKRKLKDHPAE